MASVTIELGALAPSLTEQLAQTRIPADQLERLDHCADSITTLYVHGLLSGAETVKARKRLVNMIRETVQRARPTPAAQESGE